MMKLAKYIVGLTCLALSQVAISDAVVKKTLCAFDPLGGNGPLYRQMKDYKVAALQWNVDFELIPYPDERVASEDFKSGKCDAISVTGIRGRQFNPFTGTLDSVGSLPSYDHLKSVLATMASPNAAKYMVNGPYEVVGIIPAGAAYLFVNDKHITTIRSMSGKRIAYLDNDPAQQLLIVNAGASPVASSLSNMFSKFNNGSVDIIAASGPLYEAMELYHGLEPDGGIVRFALAQLTLQIITKKDGLPDGFGQNSRDYAFSQFDRSIALVRDTEKKIPSKWWVDIPESEKTNYLETFRQSRLTLREQGVYDGKALKVFRVVRCKQDGTLAECTAPDKE